MKKTFVLLLFVVTQVSCMERPINIIFTDHALERMSALRVTAEDVNDVIANGLRKNDKDNRGVLLYSQRSALPHRELSSRDYDQLVVAVAKEPVEVEPEY